MCDYEEPSEKPPEFEMEERLDDTEDSQLATSVESEGGEAWGEGDSQPGEVEALEPEMDDSQEWTEEQTQQEGEEAEEDVKEEWIEERGREDEQAGMQVEEHLEEMEEQGNETEEQGQEVEEEGRGEERVEEIEERGQGEEEANQETDEPGEVKDEQLIKVEEHILENLEDMGQPPDEEEKQGAEPDDNAGREEGTSAEQDSIYESLADDREEALMQDEVPAAEADLKEEQEEQEEQEEPEEPAEEVEWLMEEALSEDEGEQSQMEMEATLNSFERDPSDVRPTAGSAARHDPAAPMEDEGDNNSTEDLLRLLGDESDKTSVKPKADPTAEGDKAHSDDEDEDDMSWKLNYINEAKEKLTHAAPVPTPNKIGNITLVPGEVHAGKVSTLTPVKTTLTAVKTAMTDVKKNTAVKVDSKLPAAKMGLRKGRPPQRVHIPVRSDYVGAVIKKIDDTVVRNFNVVKQSVKMDSINATTKDANASRNSDIGPAVQHASREDRKRGRESDEQAPQAKRVKKPELILNASVTTRSRVQERSAAAGGAVTARRDETRRENSDRGSGDARLVNHSAEEGEDEDRDSSDSDDGSLDDYLDSSDASSEELRSLMERTVGRAQNGTQRSRIVSARTSSGDEHSDGMFDSLSSSEDDELRAEYDFTLDVRGERASEFLPLLGRDAASLLTLQKSRLVTTLAALQEERASVRAQLRDSVVEARRLRSRLMELEEQVADD